MYNQVREIELSVQRHRYATLTCSARKDNAVHSVLLKMAGAGAPDPIPDPVPSAGGGGGAETPDGAGSLLSKYLLKSPASSKGRLPSRRTML